MSLSLQFAKNLQYLIYHVNLGSFFMRYGYARVSTELQSLDLQIAALEKVGVDSVFSDTCSGAKLSRPAFDRLMSIVKPGDFIVIYKLDRLSRTGLIQTLELLESLAQQEIFVESISENVSSNNKTPMGKAFLSLLAVFAQLERDLLNERRADGIEQAKIQGKYKGRMRRINLELFVEMNKMINDGKSVSIVCEMFNVSRTAYYKARYFFRDYLEWTE